MAGAGLEPQTSLGGTYSAPPDPVAGFGGHFAAGGGAGLGTRRERAGEGREGNWRGGKGGPQVTVEPGPLKALLHPWNWVSAQGSEETRMIGLPDDRKSFKIGLAILNF